MKQPDTSHDQQLMDEVNALRSRYEELQEDQKAQRTEPPLSRGEETSPNIQAQYRVLLVSRTSKLKKLFHAELAPFGFRIKHVIDGGSALQELILRAPDVIVADTDLQDMTGYDLCRATKQNRRLTDIPFILTKENANLDDKIRGYHVGTDEFLVLPMPDVELRARLRALVRVRIHFQRLSNSVRQLEFRLRNREKELEEINMGLIAALEKANELNDADTGAHIRRVCHFSRLLAEASELSPRVIQSIFRNASLHDVGKVATPDAILKKNGKLTEDEMREMKRHTLHGYRLLKEARADNVACNIALYHHEKWDGSGYPQRLQGKNIPIEARIVALADVFDALTSKRCYKEAMPLMEAVGHIQRNAGAHFDPRLVELFVDRLPKVKSIREEFQDLPL